MTFLDRVNPVTRIGAALVVSLPLLVTLDWVTALVALVLELALLALGGVAGTTLWRRTTPLLLVAPIGALSMALYGAPSGHEFFRLGWIHVTEASLTLAAAIFVRVLALGVPAVLLFADVDPTDMADGLAQVWRLPSRLVLGTLAGLRTVGLFRDDWRSLSQARRARGLGDSALLRRLFTMAFALLVFALRRGSKLATAMEARGFGASERTWARESRVGRPDVVLLAVAVAVVAVAVGSSVALGKFHLVGS